MLKLLQKSCNRRNNKYDRYQFTKIIKKLFELFFYN